ncbi:MAG: DNA gyrase subunit A [Euryarchaeota archaeon]|nr:DNA gyrase subunit A [Euryarchaeota archaeon]
MRYCIAGNTMVLTDQGIKEIKDVASGTETDVNLRIVNYQNQKTHASKFFNSGKHPTISLRTEQGYELEGSYNHPVVTWVYEHGIPHLKWKMLAEITKDDYVAMSRSSQLFSKKNVVLKPYYPIVSKRAKKFNLPETMNAELAFLLGALVSEGSFHNNQILFVNLDKEYYAQVKQAILHQFPGIQLYERKLPKCKCTELSIYYQHVVEFLKNIGLTQVKSEKKAIPFTVLQSKRECIVSFLRGLYEGDGSVSNKVDRRHGGKSIELTYLSNSKQLISQLKTTLLNFGIVTTLPYKDKRCPCYKLIISDVSNIKRFQECIGFSCSKKQKRLAKIKDMNMTRMSKNDFIPFLNEYLRTKYEDSQLDRCNFDRYNNLRKNYSLLMKKLDVQDRKFIDELLQYEYFFNRVKNITRTAEEKTVYSLRVDSTCHSYVANGFINHNTEIKMAKITKFMLQDIDKETVQWHDNFDGSLKEPAVLPAVLPNLLLNGSSGIAVGMATNMAPHNLSEVIDGVIRMIDDPEISTASLMEIIKGPDFPTGGIIYGREGILNAYSTGRGLVRIRAKTHIEDEERKRIIVTEIPFMVNKSNLLKAIAELVKDKKIEGISDLRDESDRKGMRIVIDLKRDAIEDVVLNQLFEHTELQSTFGILNLAIVNGAPKVLMLREILSQYIMFRVEIITKRTSFDLMKAKEKMHILEGLLIALRNIDEVIKIIRHSKEVEEAKSKLMTRFKLSEIQVKAILDMRLQKLTGMEIESVEKDYNETKLLIEQLQEILNDKQKILNEIKRELLDIKERFGDARRTEIVEGEIGIEIEDLIPKQEVIITITETGYIKRTPVDTYRTQHRGGKGVIGMKTKEEDLVVDCFTTSTHDYIMFFTNRGQVYWLKGYRIPEGDRHAKGKAIINLLPRLGEGEKIAVAIPVHEFDDKHYLVFATKNGLVKKTSLSAYGNIRVNGIRAIELNEGDEIINVVLSDGERTIMMASAGGQAVRFTEKEIRPMGRTAHGVIGMRLKKKDDAVVAMADVDVQGSLITVTENGFGKRSPIEEYRKTHRGSTGVRTIVTNDRNGKVIFVSQVIDENELIFTTKLGMTVRIPMKDLRSQGRNTMGVRIMRLNEGDRVVSITKVLGESETCVVEGVPEEKSQLDASYEVPKEEPKEPPPPNSSSPSGENAAAVEPSKIEPVAPQEPEIIEQTSETTIEKKAVAKKPVSKKSVGKKSKPKQEKPKKIIVKKQKPKKTRKLIPKKAKPKPKKPAKKIVKKVKPKKQKTKPKKTKQPKQTKKKSKQKK